jgi:hypothetical protein
MTQSQKRFIPRDTGHKKIFPNSKLITTTNHEFNTSSS